MNIRIDIDILWGGYYTYREKKDGPFSVFRLLDFNKDALHYALYSEEFKERPSIKNIVKLKPMIGHIPQELGVLTNWLDLELTGNSPLTDEDLFGYSVYLNELGADKAFVEDRFANLKGFNKEEPLKFRLVQVGNNVELFLRE